MKKEQTELGFWGIVDDHWKTGDDFTSKVYRAVQRIPSGKVATYGQIAAIAGKPGAARAVGNALHRNPSEKEIPCYRVVNAKGVLSGAFAFGGMGRQRELLEEDGVEVINNRVDLCIYQWVEEV